MFKQIKNLVIHSFYLGLLCLSHVGLLSLTIGDNWIKSLYFLNRTSLVGSLLFLVAIYVIAAVLSRVSFKALKVKTLLLAVGGLALLIYATFFTTPEKLKIIASTALFTAVLLIVVISHQAKDTASWSIVRHSVAAFLFIFCSSLLYLHQGFVFSFQDTLGSGNEKKFYKEERVISTSFYGILATEYYLTDYYIPARLSNIPSHISAIDNKNFVVIDRFGNIYHLTLKEDADGENLYARRLPAVLPINYKALYASQTGKNINKSYFRVNDLFIDDENGQKTLYVSHHFWNSEKRCITLRLLKLSGDVSDLLAGNVEPKWRVLYESEPCTRPISKGVVWFGGHQAGGRIAGLDEDYLLLSVGDHAVNVKKEISQDLNHAYGKIHRIHRRTGEANIFSLGHRNPQGLYRASDGTIWETEHGPKSGDELNKIYSGSNYGYPHVLYGTDYGKHIWHMSDQQDEHEGYERPVFAWVSAIGVSNVIEVESQLFPVWQNDLLVSSLKKRTLFRLQLHNDRVIYSEAIKIGQRIRDLTETPNGEIFLWTDSQNLIRLRPINAVPRENETLEQAGVRLFYKCSGCHKVSPDAVHQIGPNLSGIYKSKIARYSDFDYSPALRRKSDEVWSEESLDSFLENPQAFAPGSAMELQIPDEYERRALIHYLKSH